MDNDARTISVNVTNGLNNLKSSNIINLLRAGQNIGLTDLGGKVTISCMIPQGPEGPQGEQGVGISSINISKDESSENSNEYKLTATLTNEEEVEMGTVEFPEGPQGEVGPQGATGPTGTSITDVELIEGTSSINNTSSYSLVFTLSNGEEIRPKTNLIIYQGEPALVVNYNLISNSPIINGSIIPGITISSNAFSRTPKANDLFITTASYNGSIYLVTLKILSLAPVNTSYTLNLQVVTNVLLTGETYITLDASTCIITEAQLNILQNNYDAFIIVGGSKYKLSNIDNLIYNNLDVKDGGVTLKSLTINVEDKTFEINEIVL